jgi:hypothetical protein
MAARLKHNARAEKLESRKTVKSEEFEELVPLADEQHRCEDDARDAARFPESLRSRDERMAAVLGREQPRVIDHVVSPQPDAPPQLESENGAC